MNAAFLLMSSVTLAGADPTPAAPPPGAPAAPVVVSGAGCSNCAPVHSDCGCSSKAGLFDRLKAKFGKKSHDCGCAPPPCPAPCPAPCAEPCGGCHKAARPNLFDTLKARWGGKKKSCCAPACDTCGAAHLDGCAAPLPAGAAPVAPVAPAPGTGNPPKVMPKPVDPKAVPVDPKGKGNAASVPVPSPVSGAGGVSPASPY